MMRPPVPKAGRHCSNKGPPTVLYTLISLGLIADAFTCTNTSPDLISGFGKSWSSNYSRLPVCLN